MPAVIALQHGQFLFLSFAEFALTLKVENGGLRLLFARRDEMPNSALLTKSACRHQQSFLFWVAFLMRGCFKKHYGDCVTEILSAMQTSSATRWEISTSGVVNWAMPKNTIRQRPRIKFDALCTAHIDIGRCAGLDCKTTIHNGHSGLRPR